MEKKKRRKREERINTVKQQKNPRHLPEVGSEKREYLNEELAQDGYGEFGLNPSEDDKKMAKEGGRKVA